MIKRQPDLGDILNFRDSDGSVYAALVVYKFADGNVNLVVWSHDGNSFVRLNIAEERPEMKSETRRWLWPTPKLPTQGVG